MSNPEHDTEQDQPKPDAGLDPNPANNTSPPSNPETDAEAVEQGKDKLDSVVNW